MAAENSFDIVSKVDLQEVSNAIQNALKEIHTRFDLKDSKSDIQLEGKEALVLSSADEYKLKAVTDILQSKLVKRGVPIKALSYGTVEPAAGSSVRQKITMQQGIPIEKAREIVKLIKDSKKKVQASIQGDTVRVSGKDRDSLQETIALLEKTTAALQNPQAAGADAKPDELLDRSLDRIHQLADFYAGLDQTEKRRLDRKYGERVNSLIEQIRLRSVR